MWTSDKAPDPRFYMFVQYIYIYIYILEQMAQVYIIEYQLTL